MHCRLDKRKFLIMGAGIFSGLTTCLFPLTVIKTRQMAVEGAPAGFKVARQILASDGVRGLYRGFGTVIIGVIPARGVYLTTLEATKSWSLDTAARIAPSEAGQAGLSNLFAGAVASLVTQSVIVPIDVVSQRLMVAGEPASSMGTASISGQGGAAVAAVGAPPRMNGVRMARHVIATEGVLGLYRGFGMSVATFVPSSGIWWGSYGAFQKLVWHQVRPPSPHFASALTRIPHGPSEVMAVQTASALMAGLSSATLTNGLDVVKTRLQVAERVSGRERATFRSVAAQLVKEEGLRGFSRGLLPRIANTALWGTCMVTAYEFLKRTCALPEPVDR
ncbi:putative mitochondrial carrier protein [Coccomyxa subellipsoidea C-169]|uniref:Mitochondrial carrier protein n=1 Tax=Coccomyxa subellipsoidea (strain C-169) TaxID=574566 RepID=I0YSQ0_COCSC|nr:putative mitochondrial carrier protein [Coccomyxa subellipsoidea C-169]EIE21419.1 putative mitochondrial carrier protein [Coccomyxa subellipsoidea C-169]|eukprot:XP_005645963.1 putative mitochondrial carrier protein [Coccomyxa subellipsoidea C-169]